MSSFSSVSPSKIGRTFALGPLAVVSAGLVFALTGCSGTTTDPVEQAGGSGGAPAAGRGGSGGSGGAAAGAGGMAGSVMAGAAGTGIAGAPAQMLVVNCTGTTYDAALRANCAKAGCHSALYPASGMNLTPDSGLASRLKDVPAKHQDIVCEDTGLACVPATCPPPGQALLVDSADYTQSWILKKIAPGDNMCGSQMPGVAFAGPNDMACITAMVQAIAALPK